MFAIASVRHWRHSAPLVLLLGALLTGCAHLSSITPELSMIPQPGSDAVDPRKPVIVEAKGAGTRMIRVDVYDETGKALAGRLEENRFTVNLPPAFGMHYRLLAKAENGLTGQSVSQEMQFRTIAVPVLDGNHHRTLEEDSSVTLRFDRPVGAVRPLGDPDVEVRPDAQHRSVRIVVPQQPLGRTVPLKLYWETTTGVPLPPLALELTAAPPLKVAMNLQGRSDVGIALPLTMTFSTPLADRDQSVQKILIRTADGNTVSGRWNWIDERRLRFVPEPSWPASGTVVVMAEPGSLRTIDGGMLESTTLGHFATGPDRRIAVYLDGQRVVALEDGQVVRSFRVSTGKAATPTVTGSYYIYARFPLKTMRSDAKPGEPGHYVVENVPYAQYFHKDYALHGAWWHNGFGRPASHGCINLATRIRNRRWPKAPEDAGWLYQWASLGVPVTVYQQTPRQ